MKKLFTLLAMVGLALASCTPEGGKTPGGNGNNVLGAGEFELVVSNIGETTATVKITPKQEGRTYYSRISKEASLKEFATTAAYMEDWYAYLKEAVDSGNYTWADFLDKDVVEYTNEKLDPSTKYVLWAFGIDEVGNLTSTDLSYVVFETKASTFDPASWYGYWNVTAPKHVSVGVDPFSGYLVSSFVDEELEKVIAIFDASEDFGEGYVYILGLDDGADQYSLPAVATISGNKLKLENGFALVPNAEEDPDYGMLDYGWSAYSYLESYSDFNPIGGTYDAYTFTMGADNKSASVTAYEGQLTTGEPFMTDYYAFAFIIASGEYAGFPLGNLVREDGQPSLYLSGAEMTAEFLAPLEEVAAQKLNANKKFKAVHKMATPKAAAQKFSAAVNFAK